MIVQKMNYMPELSVEDIVKDKLLQQISARTTELKVDIQNSSFPHLLRYMYFLFNRKPMKFLSSISSCFAVSSWENLTTICRLLNCQPGDILEYTPEEEPQS